MFRPFGFAGVLVFAVSAEFVVVFGVVVGDDEAPGVLFVARGAVVPVPVVVAADTEPLAGVDVVGVVAGSVVSGVGSGGNGLVITPAIKSVKPTSDWL